MQILRECSLAAVVVAVLDGKTIVFPTETSYGLGCDATNQAAVDKIFTIKGREGDKPLLVVVPTVEMAKRYLVWNDMLGQVSAAHWPGPVTVVGQYNIPLTPLKGGNTSSLETGWGMLASGVVSKDATVAVRVTAFPLLQSITEKINGPLVATSANVADAGDVYRLPDILSMFKNRADEPDIVLDYGELPHNPPTTIVSVVGNKLTILRQGAVEIKIKQ